MNFSHEHHSSQLAYLSSFNQEYVYHNITVWGSIELFGTEHQVTYQAGHTYRNEDISAPSNELSVYKENSDVLINLLDGLLESDFELEDYISDVLVKAKELNDKIDSVKKLHEAYIDVMDNRSLAEQYRIHEISLSSDINCYDKDDFDENGFKLIE